MDLTCAEETNPLLPHNDEKVRRRSICSKQNSPLLQDSPDQSCNRNLESPRLRLRQRTTSLLPNRWTKYSWENRKTLLYDHQEILLENNGLRVWYEDYSTIDWMHDHVKDKVRQKALLQKNGIEAIFMRWLDATKSWILLLLVGMASGMVASFIYISQEYLTDLKNGRCADTFLSTKRTCLNWIAWNQVGAEQNYWIGYVTHVILSLVFALISVLLVCYTASEPYQTRSLVSDQFSASFLASRAQLIQSSDIKNRKYHHAAGSGIPELKTILSGFVIRKFLGLRILIVKCIGLIFSVSSGLSIGNQGPLIHISCCIGNVLSRFFTKYSKNDGKRRELLSAASAAGVSVAFAAPIGGVLFALEEVSYYFPIKTLWRSFFCALVAVFTTAVLYILRHFNYRLSIQQDWKPFELIPFALLGIIGGIYGASFISFISFVKKLRKNWKIDRYPIQEVAVIALITALVNYLNPFTIITNGALVADLFSACDDKSTSLTCVSQISTDLVHLLSMCLLMKIALTSFTFGIKVPAGIFVPSMVVGACFGRLVGLFMTHLIEIYPNNFLFGSCELGKPCVIPGVYAMVGAAAALCGVTRMTISLVVIMFELTGSLRYGLPIMISILLSKWVGDALCKESIFEKMILSNEFPYLDHKKTYFPHETTSEVMDRNFETIDVKKTYAISELESKIVRLQQIQNADDGGFPIVDQQILVGYIGINELRHCIVTAKIEEGDLRACIFRKMLSIFEEAYNFPNEMEDFNDFSDYIDRAPLTVSKNASIEMVLELFIKLGAKTLLVVNEGRLVGLIHKKKILAVLNKRAN